jgi:transposase
LAFDCRCGKSIDVTLDIDDLPTDPEALRALLIAERAQHAAEMARIGSERDRLRAIIVALQRHRFGRRSERLSPDQLALALEDLEQSVAAAEAEEERAAPQEKNRPTRRRKTNRGALPVHLPRIEVVIDVADGPVRAARASSTGSARTSRSGWM